MREVYLLSDATSDTLTDNVKPISGAMGKSGNYLYGILDGRKTDPFAPFENLYKGVLKARLSTCRWDNHLEFLRYRFGGTLINLKDATACFTEKMNVHALTLSKFIEAFGDGKFDAEEIKIIEACLDKEEKNIRNIREMLNFSKTLIQAK